MPFDFDYVGRSYHDSTYRPTSCYDTTGCYYQSSDRKPLDAPRKPYPSFWSSSYSKSSVDDSIVRRGFPSTSRDPSMADVSGKDLRTAGRRIARIAHHLLPLATPPPRPLPIQRSVASANDSYRRVHGEVSTREATWIPACDESGKEYTDIIYEKAVGEGIAKVKFNFFFF